MYLSKRLKQKTTHHASKNLQSTADTRDWWGSSKKSLVELSCCPAPFAGCSAYPSTESFFLPRQSETSATRCAQYEINLLTGLSSSHVHRLCASAVSAYSPTCTWIDRGYEPSLSCREGDVTDSLVPGNVRTEASSPLTSDQLCHKRIEATQNLQSRRLSARAQRLRAL